MTGVCIARQNGQTGRQDVLCRIDIGIFRMATGRADEYFVFPAGGINVTAGRTALAGIGRRHLDELSVAPRQFVAQHRLEQTPSLIEDRAVQYGLLPDLLARCFGRALGRAGHGLRLQVFENDHGRIVGQARRISRPAAAVRHWKLLGNTLSSNSGRPKVKTAPDIPAQARRLRLKVCCANQIAWAGLYGAFW